MIDFLQTRLSVLQNHNYAIEVRCGSVALNERKRGAAHGFCPPIRQRYSRFPPTPQRQSDRNGCEKNGHTSTPPRERSAPSLVRDSSDLQESGAQTPGVRMLPPSLRPGGSAAPASGKAGCHRMPRNHSIGMRRRHDVSLKRP